MRDLTDIIIYLCICCVPPTFVLVIGLTIFFALQNREVTAKLAKPLGLRPDPDRKFKYWGMHQSRAFYIDLGIRRTVRRHYSNTLDLALEVQLREPLSGYVRYERSVFSAQDSFENAFNFGGNVAEHLSPAARAAMLEFLNTHGPLGLEGLPLPPKEPKPEDKMYLEYKFRSEMRTVKPDEVRAMLDELAKVARVIEMTS